MIQFVAAIPTDRRCPACWNKTGELLGSVECERVRFEFDRGVNYAIVGADVTVLTIEPVCAGCFTEVSYSVIEVDPSAGTVNVKWRGGSR